MKTHTNFSADWNEILFEHRNKNYGAYAIRHAYNHQVIRAMLIASGFFALLFLIPLIYIWQHPNVPQHQSSKKQPIKIDNIHIETVIPPPVKTPQTPPPSHTRKNIFVLTKSDFKEDIDTTKQKQNTGKNLKGTGDEKKSSGDSVVFHIDSSKLKLFGDGNANKTPLLNPEIWPQFPGGENAMLEFLGKKLRDANRFDLEGIVYVTFVVDDHGEISEVKIKKDIGGGLGDAVVNAVKKMPEWKPGRQGGVPVSVQYLLPVNFTSTSAE